MLPIMRIMDTLH